MFTISFHEFLKKFIKVFWGLQHVCIFVKMEVGHQNILWISGHIDDLWVIRKSEETFFKKIANATLHTLKNKVIFIGVDGSLYYCNVLHTKKNGHDYSVHWNGLVILNHRSSDTDLTLPFFCFSPSGINLYDKWDTRNLGEGAETNCSSESETSIHGMRSEFSWLLVAVTSPLTSIRLRICCIQIVPAKTINRNKNMFTNSLINCI